MRTLGTTNSKRLSIGLLASLMIFLSGFFVLRTQADPELQPGEVMVSKSAKAVNGKINTWDIELEIKARDSKKTSDTVLIIDRSGSMGDSGTGGKTKMQNAKDAANKFIDTLLPVGNTTNRIAIVSFAGGATKEINFTGTSGASDLKSKVNGLSASGGTYTQLGIHYAQDYIATATADIKNIVLLSDGQPTYSSEIPDLCSHLTGANAWVTGTQTNTNVTHTGFNNHNNRVGNGSDMVSGSETCGLWPNQTTYFYNHGNSTIAEAGFAKTSAQTPAIYTVALSAGTAGNAVLDQVASQGNAYTGSAADLEAIFDEIAGKIASAAKDITIQDVVANEFKVISASNGGTITGNTVNWSTFQLGSADGSGIRSAKRTIRIELASTFAGTNNLYPTNTSVAFKYKDTDGNPQTKTAPSPVVNPVLIHTEKYVNGSKADPADQFVIAVKDKNAANFGSTFVSSGNFTSVLQRETGAYTISETVTGGTGQYDTTVEHTIGTSTVVLGSSFTLGTGYQTLTDKNDTNNDIYVKVTNKAKKGSLTIAKKLGDCSQQPSITASGTTFTFEIKNEAGTVVDTVTLTVSKDNCHASKTLSNLPQGVYTVTEKGATEFTTTHVISGDNTVHDGKVATVTVGRSQSLNRTVTFNNRHLQTRNITVNKTWNGGKVADHTATFELWRDGAKVTGSEKTITGNGSATWANLPVADVFGTLYTYSVKETNAPANYTWTCSGLANSLCPVPENGIVAISNTYQIPTTSFTAYKVWNGGPSPRPTVEFQLYQSGNAYGSPVSLTNGTTSYTWTNLPATNQDGIAYTYTVSEVNAPENYTSSQQGSTITNTYVSPKVDITASKIWVGGPSPRPTVEFQLLRNNTALGVPVSLHDGVASYTWNDLAKNDHNGVPYTYTVQELTNLANYTTVEDGLTVTNTYVSPKIDITAQKEWVNGPDNNRPEIQLQLKRNGSNFGSPVIRNMTTGWTYTWTNLDKTDASGVNYTYSVNEVAVPADYNSSVSQDGLTVTNTYVIPTDASATAHKIWVNGPEERPDIQFMLYRNIAGQPAVAVPGAETKTLTNGTTSVEWTGLERTDIHGNPYVFSVKEITSLVDYDTYEDGLTVTNTYVIPTDGQATATKIWIGGPSPRPTVWFQLFRQLGDGEIEAVNCANEVAVRSAKLEWFVPCIQELSDGTTEVTWTGLERTDIHGNEYTFLVREVNADGQDLDLPDYTTRECGLTVTNTYVSPKISYTAHKIWIGGPSPRPTIQLQLFRDDEPYGEPVALVDGVTSYTWDELDQFNSEGIEHIYTIDEVTVPEGYAKYIDDNRITNTYITKPGKGGLEPELADTGVSSSFFALLGLTVSLLGASGLILGRIKK